MKLVNVFLVLFAVANGSAFHEENKRDLASIIEETRNYLITIFRDVIHTNWLDEAKLIWHKAKVTAKAAVIFAKATVRGATDIVLNLLRDLKECPKNNVDDLVACIDEALNRAKKALLSIDGSGDSTAIERRGLEEIVQNTKDYLNKIFDEIKTTDWKEEAKLLYHKAKAMAQAAIVWAEATLKGAKEVAVNLFNNLKQCPSKELDKTISCVKSALQQARDELKSRPSKRDLNDIVENFKSLINSIIKTGKESATTLKEKLAVLAEKAKVMTEAAAIWAEAAINGALDVGHNLLNNLKECPKDSFDEAMACVKDALKQAKDEIAAKGKENQKRDLASIIEETKKYIKTMFDDITTTDWIGEAKLLWYKTKVIAESAWVLAKAAVQNSMDVATTLLIDLKNCPKDNVDNLVACTENAIHKAKEALLSIESEVPVDKRGLNEIIQDTKDFLNKLFEDIKATDWKEEAKILYLKAKAMAEAAVVWAEATLKGAKDVAINLFNNLKQCPRDNLDNTVTCIKAALQQARDEMKSDVTRRDLSEIKEKFKALINSIVETGKDTATSLKEKLAILAEKAKVMTEAAAVWAQAAITGAKDVATNLLESLKKCPLNNFDEAMACVKDALNQAKDEIAAHGKEKRDLASIIEETKKYIKTMFDDITTTDWIGEAKLLWYKTKVTAEAAWIVAKAAVQNAMDVVTTLLKDLKNCPKDNVDNFVACTENALNKAKEALLSTDSEAPAVEKRGLDEIIQDTKDFLNKLFEDIKTTDWKEEAKILYLKAKTMAEAAVVWAEATLKGAKEVALNLYGNLKQCPRDNLDNTVKCIKEALQQARDEMKSHV